MIPYNCSAEEEEKKNWQGEAVVVVSTQARAAHGKLFKKALWLAGRALANYSQEIALGAEAAEKRMCYRTAICTTQ